MVRVAPLHPFLALFSHNLWIYFLHFEVSKLPANLLKVQTRSAAALAELLLVLCKVHLVQHETHTWSYRQRVFVGGECGGDDGWGVQAKTNAEQRQPDHFANLMDPWPTPSMAQQKRTEILFCKANGRLT
jgi:hypothetical protein